MSSPLSRPRNVVLVVLDIIASVLLSAFGGVLAVTAFGYATQFGQFTSACGSAQYEGLTCNAVALSIATYGLMIVAVFSILLAIGMVIVSLIRRRYTFWWPLGGIIILIVAFYIAAWVAGQTVPA